MKARGFTILEILVVISVIAVLATVAIPKFKGMQEQGKISRAKSELKTLQTALESYYIHHSSYADKATWMADLTGATPQMISKALVDPFASNGTDTYKYSKNGRYYAVWSVGLDHVSATGDIDTSGNVSPGGDDIVVTNGAIGASSGGAPCTPNCVDRMCGDDGCGHSCGTCTGTGQYWDICNSPADCSSSAPICAGGYCVTGADWDNCNTAGDCSSAAPVCAGGYCSAGFDWDTCNTAGDCSSAAPNCIGGYCSAGGDGDTCNITEDCSSGFFCGNGSCDNGKSGYGCGSSTDCAEGFTCNSDINAGTCVQPSCPSGSQTDCGSGCGINLNSDPGNCGVCGNGCGVGAQCSGGTCQCSSSTANCNDYLGSRCLDSDPHNCGSCGNVCQSGKVCSSGTCVASLVTDANNCSLSGSCPNGGSCNRGVCTCSSGIINDNNNCGSCGHACSTNQSCSLGSCVDTNLCANGGCASTPCAGVSVGGACTDGGEYVGGNLEAISLDSGNMDWYQANGYCQSLGAGWSVPSIDQLSVLNANIPMSNNWHWSSTWDGSGGVWVVGGTTQQDAGPGNNSLPVRCVRSLN